MQSAAVNLLAHGGPDQCLAFILGGQPYAVPILAVQEIRRYSPPTPLPSVPSYVLGVINLRGTVVPVFDLRLRFGIPNPSFDRLTVIIVVMVGQRYVGVVADDVSKVLTVQQGQIRPSPELGSHIDVSFVAGMVRDAESFVTLLDVDRLLSEDLGEIE